MPWNRAKCKSWNTAKAHGITVVKIDRFVPEYIDPCGYMYILNELPPGLCNLDWDTIGDKARGDLACVDASRNNSRCDVGFCGHRNSTRSDGNLGMSKPRLLNETLSVWSKQMFTASTKIVLWLRGYFSVDVYSDTERNQHLSGDIVAGNVVEAIACSILEPHTSGNYTNLLNNYNARFPSTLDQTTKICPSRWDYFKSTIYVVCASMDQVRQ